MLCWKILDLVILFYVTSGYVILRIAYINGFGNGYKKYWWMDGCVDRGSNSAFKDCFQKSERIFIDLTL